MSYIAVIGAGSWGTTLGCLLHEKGYDVSIWAHEKEVADEITNLNRNSIYCPGVSLPEGLMAISGIAEAVANARYIVSVVPTQFIRAVFSEAREFGESDLAARPEYVVLGNERVDFRLHRLRQRIVGGTHVGEFGLPATECRCRRHRDSVQHAEHDRNGHVRGLGMPEAIAGAVQPTPVVSGTDTIVLVQVRDVADLRQRQAASAALERRTPEIRVNIDRDKAADLGVGVDNIATSLRTLVGGEEVTKYKEGDDQYPVRLRLQEDFRKDAEVISQPYVSSARKGLIPTLDLESIQWLEGHAYPYAQNIPYFLLKDLLRSVFKAQEGDPPEELRVRIESGIENLIGETGSIAPYLGSLFAIRYPEVEEISPELWKTQFQEAVRTIFTALVQSAPTVFYLEDLHYADPSSAEMLRYVLLNTSKPAIVLCVHRPAFNLFTTQELAGRLGKIYREIRLEDLSPSEAKKMLESLLKTESIPTDLIKLVRDKAMVAATTMVGINGNTVYALPHEAVRAVMQKYNRLKRLIE